MDPWAYKPYNVGIFAKREICAFTPMIWYIFET